MEQAETVKRSAPTLADDGFGADVKIDGDCVS
jgi:hypothetical protein